jgi:hypothetical protein
VVLRQTFLRARWCFVCFSFSLCGIAQCCTWVWSRRTRVGQGSRRFRGKYPPEEVSGESQAKYGAPASLRQLSFESFFALMKQKREFLLGRSKV